MLFRSKFDLVFYDPPFADAELLPAGPLAADWPLLVALLRGASSRVVVRYPQRNAAFPPGLSITQQRRWGRSEVSVLALPDEAG